MKDLTPWGVTPRVTRIRSMIIEHITPKSNYILHITDENNQSGLFDVTPYLTSEVFAELKENDNFTKIHNGKYFIEWDCGADLSADTIEAKWKKLPVA
jgi:hypothetical protein